MPSQDFRDIVAIKTTAQEQVAVLNDELITARLERDEAMEIYRVEEQINQTLQKDNARLRREIKIWEYTAYILAAAHLVR